MHVSQVTLFPQPDADRALQLKASVMRLHLVAIALIGIGFLACASHKEAPDGSTIDSQRAKAFSDALVDDIIHDRRQDIFAKLDVDFRKNVSPQYMDSSIRAMFDNYGQPLECTYKKNDVGYKVDSGGKKPMRKFWYSAKTTKYPSGYYLFVEVVPKGEALRTTGFALVTFPNGAPPALQ
jgi:hypothetical protein